jgi:hypothetical protein
MIGALEQALAEAREQLATISSYGQKDLASAVTALLDKVTATPEMRELVTWHDEAGAVLLSGKPAGYFSNRFDGWHKRGLARYAGRGKRQYREVVIPKRESLAGVLADAERTAAEDEQR